MAESAQSSTCPVLTGENNFTIWKIRIRAKLASAKVAGIAYGTDTRDSITAAVAAATAASISAAGSSSTIQPTDSWDIRDQKAHGIIVEHLSDSLVMALVADNQSAKELMDAVMMGMRWDGVPGESLMDHITRIRSLGSQLRGMTKFVDDEFVAFLLLHSLPNEEPWTTLRTSILNSIPAKSKLSFADVETRILLQSSPTTSASSTSSPALVAKPSTSANRSSKARKPKVTKHCEVHGECGHSTEDCNALKAAKSARSAGRAAKAKAKVGSSDSDSGSD
ncbi:hypothetical protein FISHEDRAFT_29274, partial [Fistulina hepatica ATCC 64428]